VTKEALTVHGKLVKFFKTAARAVKVWSNPEND